MESEVQYPLKSPFEYAKGGENIQASFVTLHEFGTNHIEELGKLRQWLQQAMQFAEDSISEDEKDRIREENRIRLEKGEDPPSEQEIDGPTILALFAASDVPLGKLYTTTVDILKGRGIAMLDGETSITPPLWKKITGADLESMIGTYLATFLLR